MVHLFLNCDEYLASQQIAELRAALGDNKELADLNYVEHAGERVRAVDLLAEADMMPFLTERRMIRVNGYFTALSKRLKSRKKADAADSPDPASDDDNDSSDTPTAARNEVESILRGLAQVSETCDLIFFDPVKMGERGPQPSVDASSILFKGFKADEKSGSKGAPGITELAQRKAVILHRLEPLGERNVTGWITQHVQQRPVPTRINGEATELLATRIGPDLRRLAAEVEKLSLYAGARSITAADVRLLVADESEEKLWTLTDGLSARDGRKALNALTELLQSDESPFALLGGIASAYRTLIRTKTLMQRGLRTKDQIARELALSPYTVEKAMGVASRYSFAQLDNIMERLFHANVAMVTGGDQATELEILVADLTLARAGQQT